MKPEEFHLADAFALLKRTPLLLAAWLEGLPETWSRSTEGEGTWSPHDVIGHLIHGERTDWIPRARHILSGDPRSFETFDRTAMFRESEGKSLRIAWRCQETLLEATYLCIKAVATQAPKEIMATARNGLEAYSVSSQAN